MATVYNPPINERDSDELISIAHDTTGEWQPEAITQAKEELAKREVPILQQEKRYAELTNETEKEWQEELENRRIEDYSLIDKIILVLFWFREIFSDWHLKRDGYELKYKQRRKFILIGAGISTSVFAWAMLSSDDVQKQRLEEINKADISVWKKNYIGDSLRALEKKQADTIRQDSASK